MRYCRRDEPALNEVIAKKLSAEGYAVDRRFNGRKWTISVFYDAAIPIS